MRQLIFFFVIMTATMISYQNCGKRSFSTVGDYGTDATASTRGDANADAFDLGAGGDGFNCVPGRRLAIWLDPNNSGIVSAENYLGFIVSYSGAVDAASNYNYYSYSAHPVVGPRPVGYEANVFFYEGPDGLTLNLFANVDNGGSEDNILNVDVEVSGNNEIDDVILSDDNNELQQTSSGEGKSQYQGRFRYYENTDGGVIGPLVDEDYKIHVRVLETGDIQNARFYSANGYSFLLQNAQQNISSFIITFESIEECN